MKELIFITFIIVITSVSFIFFYRFFNSRDERIKKIINNIIEENDD